LVAAIAAASYGSYLGLTPPNPSKTSTPTTGDSLRRFALVEKPAILITLAPFGVLALHACGLASTNPGISSSLLMNGLDNGLNTDLITWSPATAIPLALILCAGVPLRLGAYTSLGKNFTFTLSQPDHLRTTGIYHYVQHPSYTGLIILALANIALLARPDGVISCWVPSAWYSTFCSAWWVCAPSGVGIFLFGLLTRVTEEERMLKTEFGRKWEEWHSSTARFIPWIF
jgi:protein-S-isoprenylcysteine O-methyltransferase Ste14